MQIKNAAPDTAGAGFNEEISKENKKDFNGMLQKAIQKTNMQFFNDALNDYDKMIALDPSSPIVYFARGVNSCREIELLNKFNDDLLLPGQPKTGVKTQKEEIYQQALSDFNKVLQSEPGFAVAYYNRAYVKCQLHDFNGAVKDYDSAIHADPSLADAYYNRGLFLLYLQVKPDACRDFSKAGELGLTESYPVIKRYCLHNLQK
jgi:tetratricopeptide (TPR) repeat protein